MEVTNVSLSNFFPDDTGGPFAFTLSISPEPTCSPVTSGDSWCDKIRPLEYTLSAKVKKKAIEECLKNEFIGDSALPKKIGQIRLASQSILVSLAGGVGLMALVAVTALVLKRRFTAGPAWVPVLEEE